jgi:aminopeptidase N
VSNEFPETDAAFEARSLAARDQIKEVATLFGVDLSTYGELKVVPFKPSYKISSYLYCICVGAYVYHEKITEGYPPMRIYARNSLKDLNFDEMFTITQAGIKFYSVFFGQAYPFNKYD